jgi:hypothetical protein
MLTGLVIDFPMKKGLEMKMDLSGGLETPMLMDSQMLMD